MTTTLLASLSPTSQAWLLDVIMDIEECKREKAALELQLAGTIAKMKARPPLRLRLSAPARSLAGRGETDPADSTAGI